MSDTYARPALLSSRLHLLPCVLAACMLLQATQYNPSSYYAWLRVVVCAVAVFVAFRVWTRTSPGWAVPAIVLAVLFNPLIPITGTRESWLPFNVLGGLMMGAYACVALVPRTGHAVASVAVVRPHSVAPVSASLAPDPQTRVDTLPPPAPVSPWLPQQVQPVIPVAQWTAAEQAVFQHLGGTELASLALKVVGYIWKPGMLLMHSENENGLILWSAHGVAFMKAPGQMVRSADLEYLRQARVDLQVSHALLVVARSTTPTPEAVGAFQRRGIGLGAIDESGGLSQLVAFGGPPA